MSNRPLKVLLLASEVSPFVKTGGIADVVGELASALRRLGHDVRVAVPRYRVIEASALEPVLGSFGVSLDGLSQDASILQGTLDPGVPVYFVENKEMYDRDGIYMYPDDAERFLFFCRAALAMLPRLNWQPDVLHVNDWQTAIVPNWLKTSYANDPFFQNTATVYTIHNLAYHGTFGQRILEIAGLAQFGFIAHPQMSSQINQELNFMARGILFADAINTVSRTYAREIQTPQFGEGLDPILRMRAARLRGILNGIDYERFDPNTDAALDQNFDVKRLDARAKNKRALQIEAGLPQSSQGPLMAMIGRLNAVKGVDLLIESLESMLKSGVQLIVMGTGDESFEQQLLKAERDNPDQVRVWLTFDETKTRRILAGADMLLMPSRVEPGGTTQLLGMHYGCVPIVHKTGGLADSVSDFDPAVGTGTGFVFEADDSPNFMGAVERALANFADKEVWAGVQIRGMTQDFSWGHSAVEYGELYQFALGKKLEVIEREAKLAREIERTEKLFREMPPRIRPLGDLVYNLWWSWNDDALALLERLDPRLWDATEQNPIKLLREMDRERLHKFADDEEFLTHLDRVMASFDKYMRDEGTWFEATHPYAEDESVAYFSAEFGIHESLPIYSGGLGVLSGDHVKEASDLGVPLVGIGFLYPQGYFRQELDENGNQIAIYDKLDFSEVPATAAMDAKDAHIVVGVELPGRTVYAKVWQVQVGRVNLYLMDTDIEANAESDRVLAARLYGGDHELRIMQEIVLGIGGVKVLRALGYTPSVYHMNEGHSAFLVLELMRELVEKGMSFEDAMRQVASQCIFTTHTPVPAGNDAFSLDLMDKYFANYYPQLGIDRTQFLKLGRQDSLFSMTVLGLRLSDQRNAVSRLHGSVARKMWQWVWGKSLEETPISYITNGVHTATWLAPELYRICDEYLGANWYANLDNLTLWEKINEVPNARLWEIQKELKRALIEFVHERAVERLQRLHASDKLIERANSVLDPKVLTIGFARRFATYKRATLIASDMARLKRLVNRVGQPVQIVFAGKAHPADLPGQEFIRKVLELTEDPDLSGKIVFIENYGLDDSHVLVRGVDLWLNTPRRPLEACGTSGEKAVLNGVLNASILDGWWAEGYEGENGWAIGDPNMHYASDEAQDKADALSLYDILENQVVPLYYQRDENDVPNAWMEKSKLAMRTLAPYFSTRRMLKEYVAYYVRAMTASELHARLVEG